MHVQPVLAKNSFPARHSHACSACHRHNDGLREFKDAWDSFRVQ